LVVVVQSAREPAMAARDATCEGAARGRAELAYSCKTRYFCPSCHQKRVLLYADWAEENVLEPVAHRQYVFTVPRRLFGAQPGATPTPAR
jgi:hypothetical protein